MHWACSVALVVASYDTHAQVSSQAAASAGLEEIVVTAQKRSERLEDIPISITTVSGDALSQAGISGTKELGQLVPALRLDYNGAWAQPSIRGVGSALAGAGLNSNIATYIDGFYMPNTLGSDFDLISVANVSVLKGPQGTLFGRNATGGAILVTTEDPSFDPEAVISASYARFNNAKVGLYGSTGLGDRIAVNLAASYEEGDGYVKNIVTGKDAAELERYTIRAKALVELTDSARLIFGAQRSVADDPTAYAWSAQPGTEVANLLLGATVANRPYETSSDLPLMLKVTADVYTLKAEFDLGFADLTSYSMYRDQETRMLFDMDASNLPIFNVGIVYDQETYTQEFNLVSKEGSRLSWVTGLYYYNDEDGGPFEMAYMFNPVTPGYLAEQKSEAYALFADATYEIVDRLFFTGGVRYSSEKRTAHNETYSTIVGPIGEDTNSKTFDSTTPRAVLRWELSDRSSVYASWSQGFKSGVFNAPHQDLSDAVPPEEIDAYEIGYKAAFSGGARFTASAFYYDYQNLQAASYLNSSVILSTAGEAEIYGAEAQLSTPLGHGFSVDAGLAYTHARYKDYDGAQRFDQCLDPVACGPAFGVMIASDVQADGNEMQRAPTWSGNLGIRYETRLDNGSSIALNANYHYTSRIFFDSAEQASQGAYGLANLRATWTAKDDRLAVSLFGANLTDEEYITAVLPAPFGFFENYGAPITYGAAVTFRYE